MATAGAPDLSGDGTEQPEGTGDADDPAGSETDAMIDDTGEPTDPEDLEVDALGSNADELLDGAGPVPVEPEATGIDPLTGRLDGSVAPDEGDSAVVIGAEGGEEAVDGAASGDGGESDDDEADVDQADVDQAADEPAYDERVDDEGDGDDQDTVSGTTDDMAGADESEDVLVVEGEPANDDTDDSEPEDGTRAADGDASAVGQEPRNTDGPDGSETNDGAGDTEGSSDDPDDGGLVVDGNGYRFDTNAGGPTESSGDDQTADNDDAEGGATMAERADVSGAEALLADWLATMDVAGVRIGFSFPDQSTVYLAVGTEADGSALDIDDDFLATSITKTMTASVIFRLVDDGLLDLDQLAPQLEVFPGFAHAEQMTIRQLLQHTSGLVPYQESSDWNGDVALTVLEALSLSSDLPLEFTPGSERGYSNSGYLYLGQVAEQVSGSSYDQLIQQIVVDPAGLTSTRIDDTPRPGWIGSSAGGLIATVPDLVRWGSALYRDGLVLEPASLATMLDADNEHSTGLGANVICPCSAEDGDFRYQSIGHDGGSVTLQFSPADQMVVSAKFTESFWTEELRQVDVHALLAELRSALAPA